MCTQGSGRAGTTFLSGTWPGMWLSLKSGLLAISSHELAHFPFLPGLSSLLRAPAYSEFLSSRNLDLRLSSVVQPLLMVSFQLPCIATQVNFFLSFFFFKHLYWSIIAFQWCVSFCFITKRISYIYTYIPISSPSCISLPPPYPTPLGGQRAPSWFPHAMQLLPTSSLFYIW